MLQLEVDMIFVKLYIHHSGGFKSLRSSPANPGWDHSRCRDVANGSIHYLLPILAALVIDVLIKRIVLVTVLLNFTNHDIKNVFKY